VFRVFRGFWPFMQPASASRRPGVVAAHAGAEECDPVLPSPRWRNGIRHRKTACRFPRPDVGLEAAMQACEGIVECFRMSGGNGRFGHEFGRHILRQEAVARRHRTAPIGPVGLVGKEDIEALGSSCRQLRVPVCPRSGCQVVFEADADLGCAHQGLAAVAQPAIHREVIVQLPACHEAFHLSGYFGNLQAGHIPKLHQRVGADIAAAA